MVKQPARARSEGGCESPRPFIRKPAVARFDQADDALGGGWLNRRRHPLHGDLAHKPMDLGFIALLFLVGASGLALAALVRGIQLTGGRAGTGPQIRAAPAPRKAATPAKAPASSVTPPVSAKLHVLVETLTKRTICPSKTPVSPSVTAQPAPSVQVMRTLLVAGVSVTVAPKDWFSGAS